MDDDISRWLGQLAAGDPTAIEKVWNRYYEQLVRLARRKLTEGKCREADEEDVALSAFHSFCQGVAKGRFPQLDDRHDLWKVLMTITARKASAQKRRAHCQKRGRGTVRGESVFLSPDSDEADFGIDQALGREPTPELAAIMTEQCRNLLDGLNDELLRKIALAKLEGYSNEEIAVSMDCAPRTIERKLARIRDIWASRAEGE